MSRKYFPSLFSHHYGHYDRQSPLESFSFSVSLPWTLAELSFGQCACGERARFRNLTVAVVATWLMPRVIPFVDGNKLATQKYERAVIKNVNTFETILMISESSIEMRTYRAPLVKLISLKLILHTAVQTCNVTWKCRLTTP